MKTPFLTVVAILGFYSSCISADPEWNKEIQFESPQPGGTPMIGMVNLSGIGAVINKKDGKCIITQFFDGSGAEAAGLKVFTRTVIRIRSKWENLLWLFHSNGRPILLLRTKRRQLYQTKNTWFENNRLLLPHISCSRVS